MARPRQIKPTLQPPPPDRRPGRLLRPRAPTRRRPPKLKTASRKRKTRKRKIRRRKKRIRKILQAFPNKDRRQRYGKKYKRSIETFPPALIILKLKMDSAFQLLFPVPSPAAFVRPGDHASSAGDAPYAHVTVVVERVIRQFVSHDVIPHLPAGPGGQRVDLDHAVSRVPFDGADVGPRRRLIASERRNPGVIASERQA